MVQQPLHLIDIGGAFGFDVNLLDEEDVGLEEVDLFGNSLQRCQDLVFSQDDPVAAAVTEPGDLPAGAKADVPGHYCERIHRRVIL